MPVNAITATDLIRRMGAAGAPLLFDVRRKPAFEASERMAAGARYRDHGRALEWGRALPHGRQVVVYCVHGHEVSESAAALLRSLGLDAIVLEGGFEAFAAAGGATVLRAARPACDDAPSHWVTRERPKIDRLACPWLIHRFLDPDAVIHYVAPDRVREVAREIGGIPFDIDGVEYGHEGEFCSFDTLIRKLGIEDGNLLHLARIVRGADTARPDLEPQCAGLLAIALGISAGHDNDHEALAVGMAVYDALYAWTRFARSETHNWPTANSGRAKMKVHA